MMSAAVIENAIALFPAGVLNLITFDFTLRFERNVTNFKSDST